MIKEIALPIYAVFASDKPFPILNHRLHAGLTREGFLPGTPHYLAPETLSAAGQSTPQSDLYALGCVGYYLLTGHRVFEGRSAIEVCSQHLNAPPVPPADRLGRAVPGSLSRILMTCLEKDPARRPASARALVGMLDDGRDMAPWTEDAARAWWRARAPQVFAHRPRPEPAVDEPQSIVTATAVAV